MERLVLVRVVQRPRHGRRQPRGVPRRQRAFAREPRLQGLAADEVHDEERAARVLADVVDRDDPRVPQPRDRLGLDAQALAGAVVEGARDELDRDVVPERLVARPKTTLMPPRPSSPVSTYRPPRASAMCSSCSGE